MTDAIFRLRTTPVFVAVALAAGSFACGGTEHRSDVAIRSATLVTKTGTVTTEHLYTYTYDAERVRRIEHFVDGDSSETRELTYGGGHLTEQLHTSVAPG